MGEIGAVRTMKRVTINAQSRKLGSKSFDLSKSTRLLTKFLQRYQTWNHLLLGCSLDSTSNSKHVIYAS